MEKTFWLASRNNIRTYEHIQTIATGQGDD